MKTIKGSAAKGMILPFEPMALTFDKISYYVPFPKVAPQGSIRMHTMSVPERACNQDLISQWCSG